MNRYEERAWDDRWASECDWLSWKRDDQTEADFAINSRLSAETGKVAYADPEHYVEMRGPQKVKVVKRGTIWQAGLSDTRNGTRKATGIINCSGYTVTSSLPVLTLEMSDFDEPPADHFDAVVGFAQALTRVWVNCFYGKNRSSAVSMAILMGCHGYCMRRALNSVRRRPYDGLMRSLHAWAEERGIQTEGVEISL